MQTTAAVPSETPRLRLLIRLPFQDRVELTQQVLQPHKRLKPRRTFYSLFFFDFLLKHVKITETMSLRQQLAKNSERQQARARRDGEA